jgi:hypothetical protein
LDWKERWNSLLCNPVPSRLIFLSEAPKVAGPAGYARRVSILEALKIVIYYFDIETL